MTVKDGLLEAYHQLGGVAWLVRLGQEEPKAFAGLLARLLPPAAPEEASELVIHVIGGFADTDLATPPDGEGAAD
jgi:hypothetical protein